MAKKWLPFGWLPGAWGLKGQAYEKAKAEYELEGYDLEIKLNEINNSADETIRESKKLDIDFKYKKIDKNEYEKQYATVNKTPWVNIVNLALDSKNPTKIGEIELDWNDYFVEELKKNGYTAPSEYMIVQKWFDLLCNTIAAESGFKSIHEKKPKIQPKQEPGKKEYT